mgnify:CR=1 FL=1
MGDVYMGRSYNVVYGLSKNIIITSVDSINTDNETGITGEGYSIARQDGMHFSPEFETSFKFYQHRVIL